MDMRNELDLLEACAIGNIERVSSLLSSGVDPNFQNKVNGWTCLHWAIKRNQPEIIKLLLSFGANTRLQNKDGFIPVELTDKEELKKLLNGSCTLGISESQSTLVLPLDTVHDHSTLQNAQENSHEEDLKKSRKFYIYNNSLNPNNILGVVWISNSNATLQDLKNQISLEIDDLVHSSQLKMYRLDKSLGYELLIPLNVKQMHQSLSRHFDLNPLNIVILQNL